MKQTTTTPFTLLLLAVLCLFSCEKMVVDEEKASPQPADDANLILQISDKMPSPMLQTRADDIYWTRLNFVVYKNGGKVTAVNQQVGDADYGKASLKLDPGTYQVLVLAHSSAANPTLTSAEKIQFTNADGFSDTFYYYGDMTITNERQTHEITLERVTAMLRFIINDDMPQEVSSLRFYYTGGSGALNAKTGYGCVDSKQTVTINVNPSGSKPYTYELFTIPKETTGKLKLTVTAQAADGTAIKERTFTAITIERNKMTEFSGSFFTTDNPGEDPGDDPGDNPQPTSDSFIIHANTAWGGTITESY